MKLSLLQKLVVMRVLGFGLLVVLVVAVLLIGKQIQEIRRELIQQRIKLERSLAGAVHQIASKEQLDNNRLSLAEIKKMTPNIDNIGEVVSKIEKEARRRKVEVRIPRIQEKHEFDENGNPIELVGLLRDVRMQIEADGDPKQLMYFMHDVEYLPFLMNIVSFDFVLDSEARDSIAKVATNFGSSPPGSESEKISVKKSHLKMGVILTTIMAENK